MADRFSREHLRKLGVVPIEDHRTALSKAERVALRHDAARVQFSRQLRRKHFASELFGEAGWDILLTLYLIHDDDSPRLYAAELAELIFAPLSTTLRWLAYLEEEGLIICFEAESGEQSVGAELTHKGSSLLDRYLLELRQSDVFGPVVDNSL